MRLLLDTNIYVFMLLERESLSHDVCSLLEDYDNQKLLSMESLRELIVAYRTKGLFANIWKHERDMIEHILHDPSVSIDPVDTYVIRQMADLRINVVQHHNDPSDHIIISQAIAHHLTLISSDTKFPFYREQGLELVENR